MENFTSEGQSAPSSRPLSPYHPNPPPPHSPKTYSPLESSTTTSPSSEAENKQSPSPSPLSPSPPSPHPSSPHTQHSPSPHPLSPQRSPLPHSSSPQGPHQSSPHKTSPHTPRSSTPPSPPRSSPSHNPSPHSSPRSGPPIHNSPQHNPPHRESPQNKFPQHDFSPQNTSPQRDSPLHDPPQRESPRHDSPLHDSPQCDSPQCDSSQRESPQHCSPQQDSPQRNSPRDSPQLDSPQRASPQRNSPQRCSPQRYVPECDSPQASPQRDSSKSSSQHGSPQPDSPSQQRSPHSSPTPNSPQKTSSQSNSPQKNSPQFGSPQTTSSTGTSPQQNSPKIRSPQPNSQKSSPQTNSPQQNSPKKNEDTLAPTKPAHLASSTPHPAQHLSKQNGILPLSENPNARNSQQFVYTPPHARSNPETSNLQYSQMRKLNSQLQNLQILQKNITSSQDTKSQITNNFRYANLQMRDQNGSYSQNTNPQNFNYLPNVNSQNTNQLQSVHHSQNTNAKKANLQNANSQNGNYSQRHPSQSANLQTRTVREDEEKSVSKLLFSLAARPGFRPFKTEGHVVTWLQRTVLESGDLVDNLLKNPQAIWEICKHAPNSGNVMDALLSILGTKRLYETVKISRIKQLIHGILKGTELMHKGIASYLEQNLEPGMLVSVLDFYFSVLPYLDSDECKGIPFNALYAFQYARAEIDALYTQANHQSKQASIKAMDVLPTNNDIHYGPPYHVQKNIVDGPWPDFETYIRTQFTLLREDFTNPLREVLRAVKAGMPSKSHPWIMTQVKAENLAILSSHAAEIGMQVSFKLQRRVVNWDTFDHFKVGELLCLIGENSNKWIFAIAMFTDLSIIRRGLLTIKFLHDKDLKEFDWEEEYTMVESTNFFGAVRPVLERLQVMHKEHIPFLPVLLRGELMVSLPSYLEMEPIIDISPLYENLKEITGKTEFSLLDRWPDSTVFPSLRPILDPSQLISMKHMMLNSLAIIQGPPGTGKSFVGVKAVQLIASSLKKHRAAFTQFQQHRLDTLSKVKIKQIIEEQKKHARLGPILVICYTNHALDQFLADLLPHIPNLVRVGGRSRSTNEKLAQRNLANLLLQPITIPYTKMHLRRLIKIRKNQEKLISFLWNCYKYPNSSLPNVLPEKLRQQFLVSNLGVEFEDITSGFEMWESGNSVGTKPEKKEPIKLPLSSSTERSSNGEEFIEIVETQEDVELEKQRDMRVKMLFEQYEKNTVHGDWGIFEKSRQHWEKQSENGILPVKPMPGFTPDSLLDKARRDDEMTMTDEDKDVSLDDIDENEEGEEEDEGNLDKDVEINCLEEVRKQMEEALDGWENGVGPVRNVWHLSTQNRRNFWNIVLLKAKKMLRQQIDSVSADFNRTSQEFQELRDQKRLAILQDAPLVGMTSTQAATLSSLLQALQPSVLVVEEAAELLESQLLSCFVPSIQHLILIGDHQQLRPKVSDYESELKYDLHISMYERLIRLGVPKSTLNRQVRMRPEIADIMRLPDFYPSLQDHPLVTTYPAVKGMAQNVFFVTHQMMEDGDEDTTVKRNTFEAAFAYRLACYLMLQGYLPSDITILTPYVGQYREINNKFLNDTKVPTPKIITIDDYQGEENKIVILSLVRSNHQGILGFTKVTNRMIVGLSRAKHGFYIIGNGDMLSHYNKHWQQVVNLMKSKNSYGPSIDLACQKHFGMHLGISLVDDFDKVNSYGGCMHPCGELLQCGHHCALPCHPNEHTGIQCKMPCTRRQQCGHKCAGLCCDDCPPCKEKEVKVLPCGHRQEGECGQNVYNTFCSAPCKNKLPCGHNCTSQCGDIPCPPCKEKLQTVKQCGHTVVYTCGSNPRCRKQCDYVHPCGHPCIGNCSACHHHHIPCTEPCGRTLVCGHACASRCGRPCVCSNACENFCAHYKCTHKCEEMCAPCTDPCAWQCTHFTCTRPCYQMCDRPLCNKRCRKRLPCSHQCRGVCGELCPPCPTCEPLHKDSVTNCQIGDLPKTELLFKLHGCGHVFSLDTIDNRMLSMKKTDRISVDQKTCPTCDKPIHFSLRYGNVLKRQKVLIENMKYQWKQLSSTYNPAIIMPTLHGYSEGNCFICSNGHPYFLGENADRQKIKNCPDCGVKL